MVEIASGKVEKAIPIINIYQLGFTIPKIEAVAIKVNRTYLDMIGQTKIKKKRKREGKCIRIERRLCDFIHHTF
jgi:hypothetical protein